MNELEKYRKEIDEADSDLAKLFQKRMSAVLGVARYKKAHGLPVFDSDREAEVIRRAGERVDDPLLRSYYVLFVRDMMDIAKKYEHNILEGQSVAFSGIAGGFSEIAARRYFPDSKRYSYPDFEATYKSVESGECDCAVLPTENSYAGEVGRVSDLIYGGSLYINAVTELEIVQNLVGLPGSTVEGVREVVSHPQALMQCDRYLKNHGFALSTAENTAVAAQLVSSRGDASLAAVASEETAELYGLKILEAHINQSNQNTTKFAVLSRSPAVFPEGEEGLRSLLLLTVNHEVGSLAKAIDVIGRHGFNMTTLRSRPSGKVRWSYYFYIEIEGRLDGAAGEKMLGELRSYCSDLRVAGIYKSYRFSGGEEDAE